MNTNMTDAKTACHVATEYTQYSELWECTLKLLSHAVQVARYLGVVDRRDHDANSKCWVLSVCRLYVAKEA